MSTQRSIAKGAVWMIAVRVAERSIGFVSLLILARLLTPSDFGLVALAFSVLEVIYLLGAFSLDVALIQNQDAKKDHYDTVWTINLLMFCLYAALLFAAAYPAAHFYRDERLAQVMQVLAGGLLLRGLENIYLIDFRKEMRFDKEFMVFLVKRVSGFAITTTLAIVYRNYWALVFGTLASFAISTVFSYKVVSRRPRLTLAAVRELFHFSKWMFINNAITTLIARAPDFLIGRIAGAASLGIFNLAREVSALPTSELIAPINRAAFPGFSRLARDLPALREAYLNTLGMSLLFSVPASTGIAVLAQVFVDVALGAQWTQAAPLIQLVAAGGVISLLSASSGYVFIALGKPRINTLTVALQVPVLIPALYFLTRESGLVGAALAIALNASVIAPVSLCLAGRELHISFGRYLATAWRPCVASAAMALALVPLLPLAEQSKGSEIVALALIPVVGVLVFVASLFVLSRLTGGFSQAERIVLGEIQLRWSRLRGFQRTANGTP